VLAAIDAAGLTPTFAVNGRLAEREPGLMQLVRERGDEVIAHSWSMDTPHAGGLAEDAERGLVARTLDALEKAIGSRPRGWISPGKLNSPLTPDLLAEAGVEWFADWVNDDLPYAFRTRAGELTAMPLPTELADTFVVGDNLHSEQSWAEQVCDAADFLAAEAQSSGGGRVLGLTVHPWLMGQPHRVKHLRAALDHVAAIPGVWAASGSQIRDASAQG
jgi:peptidoglycan/xylan/chitin deacetylase (PgdA/CDA1 family)